MQNHERFGQNQKAHLEHSNSSTAYAPAIRYSVPYVQLGRYYKLRSNSAHMFQLYMYLDAPTITRPVIHTSELAFSVPAIFQKTLKGPGERWIGGTSMDNYYLTAGTYHELTISRLHISTVILLLESDMNWSSSKFERLRDQSIFDHWLAIRFSIMSCIR